MILQKKLCVCDVAWFYMVVHRITHTHIRDRKGHQAGRLWRWPVVSVPGSFWQKRPLKQIKVTHLLTLGSADHLRSCTWWHMHLPAGDKNKDQKGEEIPRLNVAGEGGAVNVKQNYGSRWLKMLRLPKGTKTLKVGSSWECMAQRRTRVCPCTSSAETEEVQRSEGPSAQSWRLCQKLKESVTHRSSQSSHRKFKSCVIPLQELKTKSGSS